MAGRSISVRISRKNKQKGTKLVSERYLDMPYTMRSRSARQGLRVSVSRPASRVRVQASSRRRTHGCCRGYERTSATRVDVAATETGGGTVMGVTSCRAHERWMTQHL